MLFEKAAVFLCDQSSLEKTGQLVIANGNIVAIMVLIQIQHVAIGVNNADIAVNILHVEMLRQYRYEHKGQQYHTKGYFQRIKGRQGCIAVI